MKKFIIDSNTTWGYVNRGTIITWSGHIFQYEITEVNHDTLQDKIAKSRVKGKITPEEIQKLYRLLQEVKTGTLIKKCRSGFDIGTKTYTGYLLYTENKEPLKIEISLMDDWLSYNNSEFTSELLTEIKRIIKDK